MTFWSYCLTEAVPSKIQTRSTPNSMATEQGTTRYLNRVPCFPGFPSYANFEKPIIRMLEESKVECLLEVCELWASKYNWIKSRSRHDTDSIRKQRTESNRTISVSSVFVGLCTVTCFFLWFPNNFEACLQHECKKINSAWPYNGNVTIWLKSRVHVHKNNSDTLRKSLFVYEDGSMNQHQTYLV